MDSHREDLPGKMAGRCKACKKEGAVFQHLYSGAYYCTACAKYFNRVASSAGEESLCHPDKQAMEKFLLNESNDKDRREALRREWLQYFNL